MKHRHKYFAAVITLPELKPGDAPCGVLEVKLFTLTGYDVADVKGNI